MSGAEFIRPSAQDGPPVYLSYEKKQNAFGGAKIGDNVDRGTGP